jgi:2-alkyl-3-oxoalkanoate reductase
VSIFDHEALVPAFAGHDAVVSIATHIPSVRQSGRLYAWAENDRIRRDGSATLADAA